MSASGHPVPSAPWIARCLGRRGSSLDVWEAGVWASRIGIGVAAAAVGCLMQRCVACGPGSGLSHVQGMSR
ncbi:hypothetical protein GQ54DRAFT_298542 [Martensiomyces pterosporus]|nr:hypothetical protein GQ54DRAFT_298542 [Martensiomyces pterosporus]